MTIHLFQRRIERRTLLKAGLALGALNLVDPLGRTLQQRTTSYGRADGKLDVAEVTRQRVDGLKESRRKLIPVEYVVAASNK